MADSHTTISELLAETKEFVDYVASLEQDGECRVSTEIPMTSAMRMRRQAEALERRDAFIYRARSLKRRIESLPHEE